MLCFSLRRYLTVALPGALFFLATSYRPPRIHALAFVRILATTMSMTRRSPHSSGNSRSSSRQSHKTAELITYRFGEEMVYVTPGQNFKVSCTSYFVYDSLTDIPIFP